MNAALLAAPLTLFGCRSGGSASVEVHKASFAEDQVRNLSQAGSIYISGNAEVAGLEALKARGVKTVIDLRLERQVPDGHAASARKLGLTYIPLPMQSVSMSDEQAEAVLKAIDTHDDAPLLLQCASSNRSGAMYALYAGLRLNLDVDAAMEAGKQAGMRNPDLAADVRTYLERAKNK